MRGVVRSLGIVVLALLGAVALAVSSTMTTVVQLLATTALIMGGTGVPDPPPAYVTSMTDNYITPFFGFVAPENRVPVHTPEEFFPVFGTLTFDQSTTQGVEDLEEAISAQDENEPLIILGYSSSTRIATIEKRKLIDAHGDDFAAYPVISFALVSNVNKPNGGILKRLEPFGSVPFFGITFDGATPTNSPENPDETGNFALDTADYTFVHDGWSDFPVYPLNLLATANAIAGIVLLHGTYPLQQGIAPDAPNVFYQGSYGDTDYFVITTEIVPLLMPLGQIGVPRPVLLAMDEPLRVLIEIGYEREISPGEPTPVGLIPLKNPITVAVNYVSAIAVGIDDALSDPSIGVGRALGTTPSGPFGVGGPTEPIPDPTATTSPSTTTPDVSALAAETPTADAKQAEPVVTKQAEPVVTEQAEPVATKQAKPVATKQAKPEVIEPESVAAAGNSGADEASSKPNEQAENPTRVASSTPPASKRNPPRQIVRGPIDFDRPKPAADRPSGNRPLQKVVKALTGQRPAGEPNDTDKEATPDKKTDDAA